MSEKMNRNLILSIDTSGVASCALLRPDGAVIAERATEDTRTHSEVAANQVSEVLSEARLWPVPGAAAPAGLAAVVVGAGPGPFTGLRVGLAQAEMLSFVWGLPLYTLCSLDALAYAYRTSRAAQGSSEDATGTPGSDFPGSDFLAATDARRKEVYWARYSAAGRLIDGPHVSRAQDIDPKTRELPAIGVGAGLYPEFLRPVPGWEHRYPLAADLGRALADALGNGTPKPHDDAEPPVRPQPQLHATPLYLRESDAKIPNSGGN